MIKETKRLYGVHPLEFMHMRYVDAIKFKIKSAKKTMKKARIAYDETLYAQAEKAKMFNEHLLDEMKSS